MDDVMRVACLTLLRHANVTLQHIPPLLNSAQFRAAMTADLDDPEGLSGFWQWYDEMTPGPARAGHRPGPGPAAVVPAAGFRQTVHGLPAVELRHGTRSSTAASCWPGCPKAPWVRRRPG